MKIFFVWLSLEGRLGHFVKLHFLGGKRGEDVEYLLYMCVCAKYLAGCGKGEEGRSFIKEIQKKF